VPENLNLLSLFDHWVEYQNDLLGALKTSNNWDLGLEHSFKIKVFGEWNAAEYYPGYILSNSSMFKPQ